MSEACPTDAEILAEVRRGIFQVTKSIALGKGVRVMDINGERFEAQDPEKLLGILQKLEHTYTMRTEPRQAYQVDCG